MITSISPIARRFLALGILCAVIVTLWAVFLQPFMDSWSDASRNNSQAGRLYTAYKNALRDEAQWASLAKDLQDAKYTHAFIEGSDANLASAKFQSDMKQTIESTNGAITSIQVLPTTKDHDLVQLNERATFSVPVAAFPVLLRQLEQRVPYVFVDSISITSPENATDAKLIQLSVSCDFHAYMLPEAL